MAGCQRGAAEPAPRDAVGASRAGENRSEPLGHDAALGPLGYTQAGFLVLGVLAAASEYEEGSQIRTTLLAMPRRLPLQAVKALALGAVTLPVAVATAATSTTDGQWGPRGCRPQPRT